MGHGLTETDQMFSVREAPWHGLGVVLDEPPRSIDEALDKAGLGWSVRTAAVHYERRPAWTDDFGVERPAELEPASQHKATVRSDTRRAARHRRGGLPAARQPRRVRLPRRADRLAAALRDRGLAVGRAARLGAGAAARVGRGRRRHDGHLRLRRQLPRRLAGRHGGGHADPDRVRQHARLRAAARRERGRAAHLPRAPHRRPAHPPARGQAGDADHARLRPPVQAPRRPARARADLRAGAAHAGARPPLRLPAGPGRARGAQPRARPRPP